MRLRQGTPKGKLRGVPQRGDLLVLVRLLRALGPRETLPLLRAEGAQETAKRSGVSLYRVRHSFARISPSRPLPLTVAEQGRTQGSPLRVFCDRRGESVYSPVSGHLVPVANLVFARFPRPLRLIPSPRCFPLSFSNYVTPADFPGAALINPAACHGMKNTLH